MKRNSLKITKRIVTIILAALAAFSVLGCSAGQKATTTETLESTESGTDNNQNDVKEEPQMADNQSSFGLKDFEGFYYETITDEIEGFEVTSINGYLFNADGTGTYYGQDVIDMTWNETEIHSGGSVYTYQMEPGKLTIHDEVIGDITYNKLAGNFIKPEPYMVDIDAMDDGIYSAEIFKDSISETDGVLSIRTEIYTEEIYDIVEINQLAKGDILYIDGMLIEVNTIDTNKWGLLIINGGLEEGGVALKPYDESNCYMYCGIDEEVSYTRHGITTLPVSEDVILTDNSTDPSVGTEYSGVEAVKEALDTILSEYILSEDNCKIRVEKGSIVEINKTYRP